jgi:predicted Holliday junction resolvase-like endonuclease
MEPINTLIAIIAVETMIALIVIVILYIRVRQLTKDLMELKRKMEITDEELYKLAEDIKEFRNLKLW